MHCSALAISLILSLRFSLTIWCHCKTVKLYCYDLNSLFLLLLSFLVGTSNHWIIVSENGTVVLFLVLGECFLFFTFEMCLYSLIYYMDLLCWAKFLLYPFLKVMIKWVQNLHQKLSLYLLNSHMILSFNFINMVYHIDWFVYILKINTFLRGIN